mmetsp:Transcript_100374/g.178392  ORF Transcript_100374/g.178392 Transcript_100374/m.178392 type:complete len:106 (+) Transcript_100374:71-388(+)
MGLQHCCTLSSGTPESSISADTASQPRRDLPPVQATDGTLEDEKVVLEVAVPAVTRQVHVPTAETNAFMRHFHKERSRLKSAQAHEKPAVFDGKIKSQLEPPKMA